MDVAQIIKNRLAELDLADLEELFNEGAEKGSAVFGNISKENIFESLMSGKPLFESEAIIHNLGSLFFYELKSTLILAVEIITASVLIGLLRNAASSFGDKTVSGLGMMISTCFITGLCLGNFVLIFGICKDASEILTHSMMILLPVMIPLITLSGGISSGGILSPVIMTSVTIFSSAVTEIILPAVFVSAVFYMINSMTEKDYVNRLAAFIRSCAVFLCGFFVTLFTGITTVSGMAGKSADGLLMKTARFSADNLIPVVGSFAADSVDIAVLCIRTVKNGIGLMGVIMIIGFLAVPLIKLIAAAFMYKITAVITEPLGNRQLSSCLNEMGNSVIMMAVVLFLTSLMFLIFIAAIIKVGG